MVLSRKKSLSEEDSAQPHRHRAGRGLGFKLPWPRCLETRVLLAVTICYMLAQVALFRMSNPLGYDETAYVSEVYPGAMPTGFGPQRARGVPWLISPASLFSPPVIVLRYYTLVLVAVGLFFAFRAWVPVLRMRAVWAAAAFGAGWLTLFSGTEIMPNLPSAVACIAACGYLAQHLSSRVDEQARRRALWKAAAWLAVVAIIRPSDAGFLAIALAVVTLSVHWRVLVTRWAVLGAGLVAGVLPWAIEAQVRFGGVLTRVHQATALDDGLHPGRPPVSGLIHPTWRVYMTLADGPLALKPHQAATGLDKLWWALLVAGIVVGIARAVIWRDRTAVVAGLGGAALAAQYLLLAPVVQPRYLLPAYGLLIVSLMAALPPLPAARVVRVGTWAVAAALLVFYAGYNANIAKSVGDQQYMANEANIHIAAALRKIVPTGPCYFASPYAYPEISFESGCSGGALYPLQRHVFLWQRPGNHPIYILALQDPAKYDIKLIPGSAHPLAGPGVKGWWIAEAPSDVEEPATATHFVQ